MTREQKIKNRELILKYGLYPRSSVYEESVYVMQSLSPLAAGRTLFTNELKSYARAYRDLNCRMDHATISSKARRDS